MIFKIFIFACLVAAGFGHYGYGPKCKIETEEVESHLCYIKPTKVCGTEVDGEVIFQEIVPDEPVCIDVVDKLCVPAKVPEEGCKERTRKACVPAHKVVDHKSGKIPEPYTDEKICRRLPKAVCKTKSLKVPRKVCEPVEAKEANFYDYFYHY